MIQKDLTKDPLDYTSDKILKKLQDNYRGNSNSILLPSLAAFTLASCGGGGGSSSYSTPNGLPLAAASSTLTIDEDSSSNALNISAPTDPDMDALTITIDSVPAGGSLNKANGDLISSGNTLSVEDLTGLTFTPNANVSSDIVAMGSLSYTVTDGKGGSASSSVTISVNALQDPPTIDSDSTVSVEENNTIVLSVSGNDVDQDTLVYSISGGSDGDLFQIDSSSGELSFLNKADFEQPSDTDTNNLYEVEVTVDDGNGNTVSQNLVVTVTNKDSIITLSNLSVDENSPGANIGSLVSYIDDTSASDTVSYSISGSGSELFEVVEGELKLKADSSADFETLSNYELTVTATSGTGNTAFDFNISVNDINDSPTAINLSSIGVSEKIDGAVVGTISTADQDAGDTHTYVVSDDRFEVIDGSLKLKAGNSVEYATESSIAITITSTDSAGVEFSQEFSIVVGSIQLSSNEFAENSDGANVGTLSITDPDFTNNVTYTLAGDDSDFFELIDNQLKLKDGNSADFESKATYNITISAEDDEANSASLDYTINVTNVNEQPTLITLDSTSFNENSISETIGVISTADVDSSDSHTYELSGADAESFEVVSSSLKLKDSISANYEVKDSYAITITSTDSGGLTTSENFSLTVNDINDAPSAIEVANLQTDENSIGAVLDNIVITDEDAVSETYSYEISGDDADSFEVVDGQLKVKSGVSLDYETKVNYSITLTATDSTNLSVSKDLTITVTNLNDNAPTFTSASSFNLVENESSVGTVTATDADGDSNLTYSISGGDDASLFSIDATTGELTLKSATSSITSTETPEDQTIIVTVAGSPPGQYYLDGVLFANYQFTVGATYTFDLSDSSNSNHPLRFSETINGTFGGGSEYTTGVSYSGTAGQAGASTRITVTESTPQLYYYCAVHSGMGGEGLLTAQAFDSSLPVTLTNMIDNGNGTFTVDIQVNPSVDSFQALSSASIWLSSGSSELTFSEDNVTISADGPSKQIETLEDGRVKLDWQDTTNSLESGTIGTLTFNAPSASNNLPITVEGQLTGGTKDSSSATDGTLKSTEYNFSSGLSDVDYENPMDTGGDNTYNVIIQVSDGENTTTQAITVNVTNDTSDDASYGSISSISYPSLDLDNSNIDFDNALPVIMPVDGDFNISSLNINIMSSEDQIYHTESSVSNFVRESEQTNKGEELEKAYTDNKLSFVVDDEEIDSLFHFSEIG
tara:strand:- start:520 stop:4182 length:3663 start_codon:yes stop_codon:yes gene_type:complete